MSTDGKSKDSVQSSSQSFEEEEKIQKCEGRCFNIYPQDLYKYVKDPTSTCKCELINCESCNDPHPENVYLCSDGRNLCPNCEGLKSKPKISVRQDFKKKLGMKTKRERKPGFCGTCKGEGLRVTFKNCSHYSCEDCYAKADKDTKCAYCQKNIK